MLANSNRFDWWENGFWSSDFNLRILYAPLGLTSHQYIIRVQKRCPQWTFQLFGGSSFHCNIWEAHCASDCLTDLFFIWCDWHPKTFSLCTGEILCIKSMNSLFSVGYSTVSSWFWDFCHGWKREEKCIKLLPGRLACNVCE